MNMKLSAFLFSALVLPSNAQDTPILRGLGRGGRGKNMFSMMMKGNCYWGANESQPLLDRVEEECATNNPCGEVDSSELDNICTSPSWVTMENEDFMIEGCPGGGLTEQKKEALKAKMQAKKETWMDMSDIERVEYKEQKEALKANNTATTLLCGCCKGIESIVTLVKDKEGAVAKTLGFRKPRGDSDNEGGSYGFGGHGHHGKPGGWSSHGSGMDIESMLEEKCPGFVEQDGCANTEAEVDGPVNCDWFDSVNVKRGRRHKNKLYCGCCRDDVDPAVDPVDPVDPVNPGGD